MNQIRFHCRLLSDIVLNAESATEGSPRTLDFIPGSNFLGIVSARYRDFPNAYEVFHSGRVRFGDAHISIRGRRALKMPLSWFAVKGEAVGENSNLWVHHFLDDDRRVEIAQSGKQIKPVGSGWFLNDGIVKQETCFAIKSAYNREKRRSEDGKMFGYQSLRAGSKWIFELHLDDGIDARPIVSGLQGERYIGRSKSAQYGRILIEEIFESEKIVQPRFCHTSGNRFVLYAESRLLFYTDLGQPNLLPTAADFNLPEGYTLNWDLSQVKHHLFAPYNSTNQAYEADRVCFEKGSVFVFDMSDTAQPVECSRLASGVGAYVNEGCGRVIANPFFLEAESDGRAKIKLASSLPSDDYACSSVKSADDGDENVLGWLGSREKMAEREMAVYRQTAAFIRQHASKFREISPSQWSQVRALATVAKDIDELREALFKPVEGTRSFNKAQAGFVQHGKTAEKWRKGKETFENEIKDREKLGTNYIVKLAAQMQKKAKQTKNRQGGAQ